LPVLKQDLPDDPGTVKGSTTWSRYAIAIGVLLLVGAATAQRSGGTRIEATW
jgi:hypothetical protein